MKEKERDSGGREKGCLYSEEQHCKKELASLKPELSAVEWTSLAKLGILGSLGPNVQRTGSFLQC